MIGSEIKFQTAAESKQRLEEMRRLHEEEDFTLTEIAEHFRISTQAVSERFRRAGIKIRPRLAPRLFERDVLHELYVVQGNSIGHVARTLGVTRYRIDVELRLHGIDKHGPGIRAWKYGAIYKLELNESAVIPRPAVRHPHQIFFTTAKRLGIKISIKRIKEERGKWKVTRVL